MSASNSDISLISFSLTPDHDGGGSGDSALLKKAGFPEAEILFCNSIVVHVADRLHVMVLDPRANVLNISLKTAFAEDMQVMYPKPKLTVGLFVCDCVRV
jgi:hypothetical protein